VEPAGKIAVVEEPTPLEKKRAELKEAIEKQDFERAAELRDDEIREMEKGDGNRAMDNDRKRNGMKKQAKASDVVISTQSAAGAKPRGVCRSRTA
jgi:hypothetical protein